MCYDNVQEKSPGPTTYQQAVVSQTNPAYKPFGSSAAARVGSGIKQVLHSISEMLE